MKHENQPRNHVQVVSLEKELNSLRIEGQELRKCVSALYACLSRLSGESVAEMEGEKEDGEGAQQEEKTEGGRSR